MAQDRDARGPATQPRTFGGKLVLAGKMCLFFVSFGFVFPTLLSE